jgi:Protein of unknown function (DUF2948)
MTDAGFEDGADQSLRLIAQDVDSLGVFAALLQDAVFPITEMTYAKPRRRFALLLNRFRWEDRDAADRAGRKYERVQSLLVFEDVLSVQTNGIDRSEKDSVLSLLDMRFDQGQDGMGSLTLLLAGGGAIALQLESLDATLRDTTRPYFAPSGKAPDHG